MRQATKMCLELLTRVWPKRRRERQHWREAEVEEAAMVVGIRWEVILVEVEAMVAMLEET